MTTFFTPYKIFSIFINSIGLFFSFLGLITFYFIYSNAPSLINQPTLRLQATLCLIDFITHLRWYFTGGYKEPICNLLGFIIIYLGSLYLCLTFIINLSFHWSLINRSDRINRNERYLWYTLIIIPLLHSVPPYVLGMLGSDDIDSCQVKSDLNHHQLLIHYLITIPTSIIFLYSLLIIIIVGMRIKEVNDILYNIFEESEYHRDKRSLIRRMFDSRLSQFIMYPLAFIIIQTGPILNFILTPINLPGTTYLTNITPFLRGLLNYLALLWDSNFQSAFMEIFFYKLDKFTTNWKREFRETIPLQEVVVHPHQHDDPHHPPDLTNENEYDWLEDFEKGEEGEEEELMEVVVREW